MSLKQAIFKAYKTAKERNWNRVYILLDVHGTISVPSYQNPHAASAVEYYPVAIKALEKISKFPEVRIILWTSSYPTTCRMMVSTLKRLDVRVDAVNASLVPNCETGDFTRKPYCSIIIDDKAGFDPKEWPFVLEDFKGARIMYKLKRQSR